MVKFHLAVMPATMADYRIIDAVRSVKLIERVGKTGNQHHGNFAAPCQPTQTTAQTDEHIGVFDEVYPFLQGQIPGEILRSKGYPVPGVAHSILSGTVDAQHSVSLLFEMLYNLTPAEWIVPVFAL